LSCIVCGRENLVAIVSDPLMTSEDVVRWEHGMLFKLLSL